MEKNKNYTNPQTEVLELALNGSIAETVEVGSITGDLGNFTDGGVID